MQNPEKTAARMAQKRAEFLRVLEATGSAVQARRAVDIGGRALRKWQEDEAFLEAYNEAIETAQDAIRAKVREMALAGDTAMLSLSMKVIEPALQPRSTVNVGVKVANHEPMDNATLAAKLNEALDHARVRGLPAPSDAVDVEAVEQVDPDDLL